MIFIFGNELRVDDIFNLYDFHEKQNIEYQLGRRAKSEDSHDDLRGSQGRNIEYQQGPRAKVDVFHVTLGVWVLKVLVVQVGPPILPLEELDRFFEGSEVPMKV